MYQIIGVDDWSHLKLTEILEQLSAGSQIIVQEPSKQCVQMWDEPISEARN